jgi:uncharacterized membrane protein SpoIIM required for sporulation
MLKGITYISASKTEDRKELYFLLCFLGGLMAGTFFVNFFCGNGYDKLGVYSAYFIDKFQNFDVKTKELFLYSFWNRNKEILLVCLVSITSLGCVTAECYLAYQGFCIGILVSLYVLRYGVGGILLYLIAIFPHYISYTFLVLLLAGFSKEIYKGVWEYRKKRLNGEKEKLFADKRIGFSVVKCLFWLLMLNVITSYLETFVNLKLMKKIL